MPMPRLPRQKVAPCFPCNYLSSRDGCIQGLQHYPRCILHCPLAFMSICSCGNCLTYILIIPGSHESKHNLSPSRLANRWCFSSSMQALRAVYMPVKAYTSRGQPWSASVPCPASKPHASALIASHEF